MRYSIMPLRYNTGFHMPETPSASATHFVPPPRTGNVWAVLSLICGVLSLLGYLCLSFVIVRALESVPLTSLDDVVGICGIITAPFSAIFGIVFGYLGLEAAKKRPNRRKRIAVAGVVLSAIGLATPVILLIVLVVGTLSNY